MNIDCQIRNKSTIHEALSTLCEDEIMEGDNKVLCDRCKVKTNTVLRTAISTLPDVLILSLKRFDLDYTTFETVKLNSRCEFEEALNMKQYTLEAKELLEATATEDPKSETGSMMDLGDDEGSQDPLRKLPDEEYEYKLVGVLVHAGVAQGGHYYSFIKDRTSNKWYRFDDEDVTPFDPSLIEQECFGGKLKKETKYPNGQVHTVENEQFANALMLLYEKVKPTNMSDSQEETPAMTAPMDEEVDTNTQPLSLTNGYEVFLPSVKKSNSTHSWQSFLLTTEFQSFMGDMLSQSVPGALDATTTMDDGVVAHPRIELGSWRFDVVQLSLSFLFDLLFHLSLDKSILDRWLAKFVQIFSSYPLITEAFVSSLAQRTRLIYENWIRAYTVECSEESSRRAALQIISSAMGKQVLCAREQKLLQEWAAKWHSEWASRLEQFRSNEQNLVPPPMPTGFVSLEQGGIEDVTKIGTNASGIGIIISFVTLLLELSPRIVQSRIELFYFVQLLARCNDNEGRFLSALMSRAHIPLRLICLAWREKFHHNGASWCNLLFSLFPGATLNSSLAIGLCKHEAQSILQMGMNNNGGGNQFTLSNYDVRLCLEAFSCILGVPYCVPEDITYDTGEVNRGRAVIRLTPLAVKALTSIFEESRATSTKGLTRREILQHVKRCGMRDIPPQKIDQIFQKYAVVDDDGSGVLPFDGFLELYQSYACSNDDDQVSLLDHHSTKNALHTSLTSFYSAIARAFGVWIQAQLISRCTGSQNDHR